jgi:predicted thioesterase
MTLRPGLAGTATMVVADEDTALALGSGDVPVLATPRVALLAEEATVLAVASELGKGETTVGYRVQLDHLAPTAVGGRVVAEATLETVESRRLTFRVSVSDGRGLVAAGRITRVVVQRDRFLEKAAGAEPATGR